MHCLLHIHRKLFPVVKSVSTSARVSIAHYAVCERFSSELDMENRPRAMSILEDNALDAPENYIPQRRWYTPRRSASASAVIG